MPDKYAPCKRGCCWNHLGTCGRNRTCACHSPLAALVVARAAKDTPKPAPANVTPLFQEPK